MKNCPDLFLLSAIACQLSQTLSTSELEILAASLTALGDMLAVILSRQDKND